MTNFCKIVCSVPEIALLCLIKNFNENRCTAQNVCLPQNSKYYKQFTNTSEYKNAVNEKYITRI